MYDVQYTDVLSSSKRIIERNRSGFTSPMSAQTPILPCRDHSAISITPSQAPLHRLQSPSFEIPYSILSHLETASQHLHASRTVAFPTETVYGLGASSLDPKAVKKIYEIKNRPFDNPLIIHVSSLDMLQRLLPPPEVYHISKLYHALIAAFWPGPLTLLFPSSNSPPPPAPQTSAIRMPAHPLALALIHHADLPLSAPSANSSGRPSPTKAQHVHHDLNGAEGLGCILDGGDCGVGVESTVVDGLSWKEAGGGSVNILRPGGLGIEDIARVVADADGHDDVTQILVHGKAWRRIAGASSSKRSLSLAVTSDLPPATPGMKYKHYSPRIPVYLLMPSTTFQRPSTTAGTTPQAVLRQIAAKIRRNGKRPRLGLLHYENSPLSQRLLEHTEADTLPMSLGPTPEVAAQRLFSGMLELEGSGTVEDGKIGEGVDAILIEGCSEEGLGLAVMERIGKAVGGARPGGGAEGTKDGLEEGNGDDGRFWVEV